MTYKLTIHKKPTYLHIIAIGENSSENVARYLEEVLLKCEEADCHRVLIEERLEGPRLNTLEVFQVVSAGSGRAIGKFRAIAYVDVNADGELMQFAETVALNRAIPVSVFATVAEAEQWLLAED